MDFYITIILSPDPEMPLNRLMSAVYSKLHKALYDSQSNEIGVSFPKSRVTLGNVLRLHGSKEELNNLQKRNWIGDMRGYCGVSEVLAAPDQCQYRSVSRVQTTMSQSKLNRLLKRGSITQEEAKQYRAKMFTKGLDNPYIELTSGSNGHKHRRYIAFGQLVDTPVSGHFDQFGFSKTATVPWFR